ncbi:MAG: LysM peptidoglycan-binding domain-containing protein [Treponema sp.]|jgi:hypothetical protein|nr:LysM peptidoglycan-binding domain-containing protein [Treponema sp.]
MSRHITVVLSVILLIGIQPLFAQYEPGEPESQDSFLFSPVPLAAAASTDEKPIIPGYIRNNRYYLESLRLTKLAQDTYEYGDYDLSTEYANEAIRYAELSDEYVSLQLKIKEANDTISAAKQRLDWTVSSGAAGYYPVEYGEARQYYEDSLAARSAEEWDEAIAAARQVINILAYIQVPVAEAQPENADSADTGGQAPLQVFLPAQYTVKPWASSRDCLWNIAGRPWAYGDPNEWRLLYNANRAKLPDPNNPNLILPGMVLDIPSIRGEERQGMWDDSR